MTAIRFRAAALCLGFASLIPHHAAYAQASAEACIAQADVSDGVIYAMPLLMAAVRGKCDGALSSSGFLATGGDAFIAPFAQRQGAAWPGAMRMLSQFGGKGGAQADEMMTMFQTLPPETVRPLFDAVIEQKVAEEIKVGDCAKIERGVELLSPLPPENVGGLITFLLDVAKVDNPKVCPAAK